MMALSMLCASSRAVTACARVIQTLTHTFAYGAGEPLGRTLVLWAEETQAGLQTARAVAGQRLQDIRRSPLWSGRSFRS